MKNLMVVVVASIEHILEAGKRNRRDSVVERICRIDGRDDVGRVRVKPPDVRKHQLFPAASEGGVGADFVERSRAEERAGDAGVGEINLGRLHKPLAEVGYKRRHDIDHESFLEEVDVSSDSHVGYAERGSKSRIVDHLRVFMGKHPPESSHRLWYEIPPERKVTFKKRLDEGFEPFVRRIVVRREIGTGESSTDEAAGTVRRLCGEK